MVRRKKLKIQAAVILKPEPAQNSKILKMSTAQYGDERPWEKALRNPLVLQNIFQFLPTGCLLSSCSLVNKSWNKQTRTYVRDNRKCTTSIRGKPDEFLKHFDKFYGQIIANGRIVPFNSLSSKGHHCELDSSYYEEYTTPNLRSEMKLLHVDIECRSSWSTCHVHNPLFDLVQQKSSQLQSLKITQHEDDATLFEKIIEAKPQLKTFSISVITRCSISSGNDLGHQQQRFDSTLEKLLQTSNQTLRSISIGGVYEGIGRLSHPPLVNLSKLRMNHLKGPRDTEKFFNTVATIDYTSKMPKLREVEFSLPLGWRTGGNIRAMNQNSCTTVRNLTLFICGVAAGSNFPFFIRIFPNVSSLKLNGSFFEGILPFTKIWELLPRLEQLEISGTRVFLRDSYDSDFCGIHPEEAKLLRENDEEYLETVQIVPTSYSILSMKCLRKLRINLKCVDLHSPGPDLNFMSKVTEMVVFWKMPHVDISVIWSVSRDSTAGPEEKYSIIQPPGTLWSRKKVLEKPRLLQKILAHLPTSLLLSSCSLINRTWNSEVRKFVLENRKFTATITYANSTCELVEEFDQLCCQISQERRIIPWNRVKVHFSHCNGAHMEFPTLESDEIITLTSPYKPNYLELHWDPLEWEADCPEHRPLEALLREWSSELRIFKIGNLPLSFGHILSGCANKFPKLEEIIISNLPDSNLRSHERKVLNQIVRCIVERAPKMLRIVAKDTHSLEIIPKDKYGLLDTLKFHFRHIHDANLYVKVAQAKPALRKLRIFQPFPVPVNEYAPVSNFREAFNKSLEQLLQACHQKLEVISIESVCSLSDLSFPPLRNLRQLKLKTKFGPLQNFAHAVLSIDYGYSMPMLEEVELKMGNFVEMDSTSRAFFEGDASWPCFDENQEGVEMLYCSNSVRRLTLELHVKKIHLSTLHSLFPGITFLEIKGNRGIRLKRDSSPFSEIFQLWPDLVELRVFGAKHFPSRDYDADLCGIHENEAELYRKMNADFLQNVQIVPIKPSLHSMTSLRKLWIESGIDGDLEADQSDSGQFFVSKVAEFIAFKRMHHLKVCVA